MKHQDQRRSRQKAAEFLGPVVMFLIGSYSVAFPEGWTNEDGRPWPPSIIRAVGVIFTGGGFIFLAEAISSYASLKAATRASRVVGTLLLVVGIASMFWRFL